MEIPQRIVWGVQNSRELFVQHPLLVWNLLRSWEGLKIFFWFVGGASGDVAFHTTNDDWKEVKKMIRNKFV